MNKKPRTQGIINEIGYNFGHFQLFWCYYVSNILALKFAHSEWNLTSLVRCTMRICGISLVCAKALPWQPDDVHTTASCNFLSSWLHTVIPPQLYHVSRWLFRHTPSIIACQPLLAVPSYPLAVIACQPLLAVPSYPLIYSMLAFECFDILLSSPHVHL